MKHSLFSVLLSFETGLLLLAGPASAQLAEGLDTDIEAAAPPTAAAVAPKPEAASAATPEAEPIPSRYAAGELTAYVAQMSARLSIRNRDIDPFGRHQDPDYVIPEPKVLTQSSPTSRFKPEPPVPFADVISGIAINTVIPGKQKFLIGNREFKVSDILPLRLPNGKQIKAQVVSVSATRIRFKNPTTQEVADLNLNMLPAGMKRGTGAVQAPGMEANDSSAPIEIQPTTPLSTNSP